VRLSQLNASEVLHRDSQLFRERLLGPSALAPELCDPSPDGAFDLSGIAGAHPATVVPGPLSKKYPYLIVFRFGSCSRIRDRSEAKIKQEGGR
jgi:hypothetical protein